MSSGAKIWWCTSIWADTLTSTSASSLAKRTASGCIREVSADLVGDVSCEILESCKVGDREEMIRSRSDQRKLCNREVSNSNCEHIPSLILCILDIVVEELSHTIVVTVSEDKHDSWSRDGTIRIWLVSGCAVDTTVDASVTSSLDVSVDELLDG